MRERVTRRQTYFGLCALVRGWADALSAMRVCLCVLDSTSCRIRVRVLSSRARGGRSRFYVWREACAVCRGQKGMCSSRSSDKSGRDAEKNHPESRKRISQSHYHSRLCTSLLATLSLSRLTRAQSLKRRALGITAQPQGRVARSTQHTHQSPRCSSLSHQTPLSRGHKPA